MEVKGIKVQSVNISEQKGTVKKSVDSILLTDRGVDNDAHSGKWHRQVSLLGLESFEKFSLQAGRKIEYGEFAENITTEGIKLYELSPFDRFVSADVELEVTQIGKKCHGDSCAIYREVGNCVMPKEGIFCRVLKGGEMKAGDFLEFQPFVHKALIITLSDRASAGEYQDLSGPAIQKNWEQWFRDSNKHFQIDRKLIPDDPDQLKHLVEEAAESYHYIITTGGTGLGSKDFTVDVVQPMLDKEIPGIMEHIRYKYGSVKPNALLSRGVAGLIGKTQVYTLPGSVKAVNEYMTEILKTMHHLMLMVYDIDAH